MRIGVIVMPLIQGGPPAWIWERSADFLKPEIVPTTDPNGHTVYELRLNCGIEIMRLQFFTREEVARISECIAELP
jgi:hypothetical protein